MPNTRQKSRKTLARLNEPSEHTLKDKKIDDVFRKVRRCKAPRAKDGKDNKDQKPCLLAKSTPGKAKKKRKDKQISSSINSSPIETGTERLAEDSHLPKATSRNYHTEASHNGITYAVGDSAYVVLEVDNDASDEEELEVCEICEKTDKRIGRKQVPMLECETCLRGYHLNCISPPLETIPEGEWHCQYCALGQCLPPRKVMPDIARERFFNGSWGLAKIEALYTEGNGEMHYSGRWYNRPEDTHSGRQKHHGAREVFLTNSVDNNPVSCLDRLVPVCLPSAAHQYDSHPDVFTCEYEYDTTWKRFKRLTVEELDLVDADWAASSNSESDADDTEHDRNFKPIYAYWAEKGLTQSANMRKGCTRQCHPHQSKAANKGRKAKMQGGELWAAGGHDKSIFNLGASQIPDRLQQRDMTDLDKTRSVLALTAAPRSLSCRESERDTIAAFVTETVQAGPDSLGSCLYISGVPGTGKTATVLEVMHKLRGEVDSENLPSFQFVEMNSLRLPSPQHAYTQLLEALTGQHLSPSVALTRLEEMFDGSLEPQKGQQMTVILADEIDMLVTRNQQVLYNLFEWPTRHRSKLAMIAVANTMDLPERLLPRIASRLGGRRLAFQPYNKPQLIKIVTQRLEDAKLVHTVAANAINMACSKVAGVSGDVRRVLQLCRKAAEICQEEGGQQVAMRHINLGVEEMFSAAHMQLLTNCCPLDKLVLAALVLETKAQGRCDAVVENVVFRLQQLAEMRNLAKMSFGDCLTCCKRLAAKRLLLTEQDSKRLWMRLSLNVPQDDVIEVLQHDQTISWLKDLNY